jgi:hypothetical protein
LPSGVWVLTATSSRVDQDEHGLSRRLERRSPSMAGKRERQRSEATAGALSSTTCGALIRLGAGACRGRRKGVKLPMSVDARKPKLATREVRSVFDQALLQRIEIGVTVQRPPGVARQIVGTPGQCPRRCFLAGVGHGNIGNHEWRRKRAGAGCNGQHGGNCERGF